MQNSVTGPRPRRLRGNFMVGTQQGSVIYVCAKFEAGISIRSKVIRRSKNFEIWSRDLGHAHLGVGRSRDPSSMSAKFEADNSIRSKVIRGSQNFEIWSRDLGPAHFGVIS